MTSPSAVVAVLEAARAKIERPESWCKGSEAVDECGAPIWAGDERACRWCAFGAIKACDLNGLDLWDIVDFLDKANGIGGSLGRWNDAATHAEVLAAFDRALTRAKDGA